MTALIWDKVGERYYQTGVDRGVLYLSDGSSAPWNGLISVEENSSGELKSYYLDGVKYLETIIPDDFSAKLKAYTYPDIFDLVNGVAALVPGLSFYNQLPKSFGLSYRTKIGNDLVGLDYNYKIHLLYNLVAVPDSYAFETIADSIEPIEFSWVLSGTPQRSAELLKPTAHISIDTVDAPPDLLLELENILYGTSASNPRLPSIDEVAALFDYEGNLVIVDNGDGTWTAIDESGVFIVMLDPDTFEISGAAIEMIDADTYTLTTTDP